MRPKFVVMKSKVVEFVEASSWRKKPVTVV